MNQQHDKQIPNEARRHFFRAVVAATAGSVMAGAVPAQGADQTADLPLVARGQRLTEHQKKYYRTARML